MDLPGFLTDGPTERVAPSDSLYAPIVWVRGVDLIRTEDLTEKEMRRHAAALAYNRNPVAIEMHEAIISEAKRRGLL